MAEQRRLGDCYQVAGTLVLAGVDLVLCHGEPIGRGPIEGIRHGHAWVERSQTVDWPGIGSQTFVTVIDRSNGHDTEWPAEMYYNIGRIEPGDVVRYSRAEAAALMVTTGHYGPWK